jgi:hypothetical protein
MSDGSCMTEPICNITVGQAITYLTELREMVGYEREKRRTDVYDANRCASALLIGYLKKIDDLMDEVEKLKSERTLAPIYKRANAWHDSYLHGNGITYKTKDFDYRAVLEVNGSPIVVSGTESGLKAIAERWKKLEQIEDLLKGNPIGRP